MKKCYVSDVEVSEKEIEQVENLLLYKDNLEHVTDYYNLVHCLREGDEYYHGEYQSCVLSMLTVVKALRAYDRTHGGY